jgi:dTDP-4-dehydrorhamnose 3,5-epimerase
MSRFIIEQTPLPGLTRLERMPIADSRGFLTRIFCGEELVEAGWNGAVAQINHTRTERKGVVRGVHFQHPPHAETKIVTCLQGSIFDVAVDLRADSSTLMRWHAEVLSAENNRSLLIPPGFAHGFQTLSEDCDLLYLHSVAHAPESEDGIHPEDAEIDIDWPLPITELSSRDAHHPSLSTDFKGLNL